VLFADPRKSTVDIVQAVGRALRIKEGKKYGYVILPVFTNSNKTEEIIESAEFKEILSTIRALASNDERIIEYFRDVSKGVKKNNTTDKLIQFDIDEQIATKINIQELTGALQLKTWDKLAKLSWMPFEEAREIVISLKIKSAKEYRFQYYKKRNAALEFLPSGPERVYYENGWTSWGDWLGTNYISNREKEFLTFEKAREIVRSYKFKNAKEWQRFAAGENRPDNIPASPPAIYRDEWISWGDWLGKTK
jgi:hypothetical protein